MYKTYKKYKTSGIEWIGEIPEHWEITKIKYLAIGDGSLFIDGDWIESKDIVFNIDHFRYITTGNVGEGIYKEQGSAYITSKTFKKLNCTEVYPGDLIISRLNPPIGRCCIVPDLGSRIVTSVDNVILRPHKKINKRFLRLLLSNNRYYEFNSLIARGATMQRISRSLLGDVQIPVTPNIVEQTQIANFLDKKTEQIDNLIAKKEQLIKLLEEEKTAVINEAVTKGINPNVKLKDSGIEWLGKIPEHWKVARMINIGRVNQGLQIPISKRSYFPTDNSFPYITIKSINNPNDAVQYIDNPPGNVVCDENDILVARTGATGEIITNVQGVFHNNFFRLKYRRNKILKNYLVYFLKSPKIKEYLLLIAGTTTIPDLNHDDFYNTPSFIISMEEQGAICNYIQTESARIDKTIEITKKLIELLKEYRTSLISEAVTGKIKVIDDEDI